MPTQSYALEPGGPKRLELSWTGIWKNIDLTLDGQPVGTIADQKQLTAGQEFRLPDGSTLKVQLARSLITSELQVLRDGRPLPGSASDPEARVRAAYQIVYFIAGLNIVVGAIAWLFQVEFLQQLGLGAGSVVFGLVFVGLGFFVQRCSRAALIVAIGVFALDGLLGLVFSIAVGGNPAIGGLIARAFLLLPMIQGVGALQSLRQQSERLPGTR